MQFQISCYDDLLLLRSELETRYPHLTGNGRYIIPRDDSEFWEIYRANKEAMRQARCYVFKDAGNWVLEAKPLYNPEEKKRAELAKVLERWQPVLDQYPHATEIEESIMRNGVSQYLLCPKGSGYTVGSALPFRLVEHLLKDRGYVLVTRAEILSRRRR